MNASPPGAQEIPKLQRLFENIWFLLLIGVLLPTVSYTAWSLADLALLPHFEAPPASVAPREGGATPGTREAAAASTSVAPAEASAAARETSSATAGATTIVSMRNMAFDPKVLEVEAGSTVTWINRDQYPHSVASGTPDTPDAERLFPSSGDYGFEESFSYTFTEPGRYEIYCATPGHYQAGMTMTVIVEEARR